MGERFDAAKTLLARFEEDYEEVLPSDDRFIAHCAACLNKNRSCAEG